MTGEKVEIHGGLIDRQHVIDNLKAYAGRHWRRERWQKRPALLGLGAETKLYHGQPHSERWTLVQDGWDHDLCVICYWALHESVDPERGIGYVSESDWICIECHDRFIVGTELCARE